jgi:transposase
MLLPLSRVKIFVFSEPCDMRKGIEGLSGLVRGSMSLDPLSGHCFCFLNQRRTQVKVLYWDTTGYCIWMKRLSKGAFPALSAGELLATELLALLEGARPEDLSQERKKRYLYRQ